MQATVASFDDESHRGRALLDDGTPVELPAAAFEASGLRLLRVGQRLRLEQDSAGAVIRVTLVTMP